MISILENHGRWWLILVPLKIRRQREAVQSRSSSKIYERLPKVLLVGIRVGHVAQTHMSFSSLYFVSDAISMTLVKCRVNHSMEKLTNESNSPVSRDCVSAASTAFLKYSVAGRRMPRAST